jgi:hypothetical protein
VQEQQDSIQLLEDMQPVEGDNKELVLDILLLEDMLQVQLEGMMLEDSLELVLDILLLEGMQPDQGKLVVEEEQRIVRYMRCKGTF